jgi:hypothetical protein
MKREYGLGSAVVHATFATDTVYGKESEEMGRKW